MKKREETLSFYCGDYVLKRNSSAAWWSFGLVSEALRKNFGMELYLHGFLWSLKQSKNAKLDRGEFILESKDLKKLSERLRIDARTLVSLLKRMKKLGFIDFLGERKEKRNRKIKFRIVSVPEAEKKLDLEPSKKRFMVPLWAFDRMKLPMRKVRAFLYGVYEEMKKERKIFFLGLFKNASENYYFNKKAVEHYSRYVESTKLSPWNMSYLDLKTGNETNFSVESSALSTVGKDLKVSIGVARKLRTMAEKIGIITVRRNLTTYGEWDGRLYRSLIMKNKKLIKKIKRIDGKMVFCGTSCVRTNDTLRRAMMTWNMDRLLSHFGMKDAKEFANVFFPQDENGKKINLERTWKRYAGTDYVSLCGGATSKVPLFWKKKNLAIEKKRLVREALATLQKESQKNNLKFFKRWLFYDEHGYCYLNLHENEEEYENFAQVDDEDICKKWDFVQRLGNGMLML